MSTSFQSASLRCQFLTLTLFCLGIVSSLHAQRITVTDRFASPVVVESAAINTEVTGRIAVTTFDLIFRNPNNRVLEGTFEFPLLEGQSVIGLSLDINGRQREAVPVEKDRGRIVFEEITRRRVDPALLEKTAGNNYRLRIFPLPAKGTRRVVITYQQDLMAGKKHPVYQLALDFPNPLETFQLSVDLQTAGTAPAKMRTTLPLKLPAWRDKKHLDLTYTKFVARGIFELELPQNQDAQVATERRGDKEYFYAEVPVAATKSSDRPAPPIVGILWDASGSGRDRDHAREFSLLDSWFNVVKEVEVRLHLFRDRAETPVSFKVVNGDWSRLHEALSKIVYDGATSFDDLRDDSAVGEWLMFSDGLANYGLNQTALTLPMHAPVHTILASPQANPALLRGLAQHHAGTFVNLFSQKPEKAARLLRQDFPRVLAIEHNPEQVAQIFPEANTAVTEGTFVVTGILHTPEATVRLQIGHNASDAKEITLSIRSGENPSRVAARAWATTKISSLEIDPATNRDDIRRTSQEFCIVTADTSLIVLETLQDYLRYDIAPPDELRAAWEASRCSSSGRQWKGGTDKLNRIVQLFAEKTKWWETKFPEEPPVPPQTPEVRAPNNFPTAQSAAPIPQTEANDSGIQGITRSELPGSAGEEVVVLSPFEVTAPEERGYMATQTLAGSRLRTELRDVAASISATDFAAPSDSDPTNNPRAAGISLKRWEANAGYLDRLRRAKPEKQYSVYLEERIDHATQPGFFLDVAEFFFEAKNPELALRILSNLAELQLDDPALLRVLAHRLVQAGHPELAQPLFERVLVLRPEEPQSRRDLALVCSDLKQYQRAVDLLWEIVTQTWDGRFPEIEMIALGELNTIVSTCGQHLDLAKIDARLLRNLPVGLRVILTWDANDCDIDLWVDDPNGEQAIFSHPRTAQGGRMSHDLTGGYGPEEFLLRTPKPGKYTVKINYYGDGRQTAFGPVTAQIRLITGFGTPAEKEQRLTVRLTENKETLEVGEITIAE